MEEEEETGGDDYHQLEDDELGAGLYTGLNSKKDPDESGRGFSLPRVAGIIILTFFITIFALIFDDLSTFSQSIKRTNTINGVTTVSGCKVKGSCGYSKGRYKYTTRGLSASINCPAILGSSTKYNINYSKYCDDDFNGSCRAMNSGNAFVAFGIFSILFTIPLLIIVVPMWCRKRWFPKKCIAYLRWILGILFALVSISNFLGVVIWLAANVCDNADPTYKKAFDFQSYNTPGVSSLCMLLCFVANLVGTGAVCCCWMDHKQHTQDYWSNKDNITKENEQDYFL